MTIQPMQQRYDTAANWTEANPVLRVAEIGHETDTGKTKIGDGVTSWSSLTYWNPSGIPSSDLNYTQSFNLQTTVAVPHSLGKYPSVTVFTSSGLEVEGDVTYTDLNNLTLTFSAQFSGTVTCN